MNDLMSTPAAARLMARHEVSNGFGANSPSGAYIDPRLARLTGNSPGNAGATGRASPSRIPVYKGGISSSALASPGSSSLPGVAPSGIARKTSLQGPPSKQGQGAMPSLIPHANTTRTRNKGEASTLHPTSYSSRSATQVSKLPAGPAVSAGIVPIQAFGAPKQMSEEERLAELMLQRRDRRGVTVNGETGLQQDAIKSTKNRLAEAQAALNKYRNYEVKDARLPAGQQAGLKALMSEVQAAASMQKGSNNAKLKSPAVLDPLDLDSNSASPQGPRGRPGSQSQPRSPRLGPTQGQLMRQQIQQQYHQQREQQQQQRKSSGTKGGRHSRQASIGQDSGEDSTNDSPRTSLSAMRAKLEQQLQTPIQRSGGAHHPTSYADAQLLTRQHSSTSNNNPYLPNPTRVNSDFGVPSPQGAGALQAPFDFGIEPVGIGVGKQFNPGSHKEDSGSPEMPTLADTLMSLGLPRLAWFGYPYPPPTDQRKSSVSEIKEEPKPAPYEFADYIRAAMGDKLYHYYPADSVLAETVAANAAGLSESKSGGSLSHETALHEARQKERVAALQKQLQAKLLQSNYDPDLTSHDADIPELPGGLKMSFVEDLLEVDAKTGVSSFASMTPDTSILQPAPFSFDYAPSTTVLYTPQIDGDWLESIKDERPAPLPGIRAATMMKGFRPSEQKAADTQVKEFVKPLLAARTSTQVLRLDEAGTDRKRDDPLSTAAQAAATVATQAQQAAQHKLIQQAEQVLQQQQQGMFGQPLLQVPGSTTQIGPASPGTLAALQIQAASQAQFQAGLQGQHKLFPNPGLSIIPLSPQPTSTLLGTNITSTNNTTLDPNYLQQLAQQGTGLGGGTQSHGFASQYASSAGQSAYVSQSDALIRELAMALLRQQNNQSLQHEKRKGRGRGRADTRDDDDHNSRETGDDGEGDYHDDRETYDDRDGNTDEGDYDSRESGDDHDNTSEDDRDREGDTRGRESKASRKSRDSRGSRHSSNKDKERDRDTQQDEDEDAERTSNPDAGRLQIAPGKRKKPAAVKPKLNSIGEGRPDVTLSDEEKETNVLSDAQKRDLFTKCRNNRYYDVEAAFAAGVPVSTKDKHGNSCLHIACQNNNKRMAKVALRWGADINAQNNQGQTPLHYCFAFKYIKLAEYLTSKGARDDIQNYFEMRCYDGLRPHDKEEAMRLLRKHMPANVSEAQLAETLGALDGPAAGAGSARPSNRTPDPRDQDGDGPLSDQEKD